VAGGADASFPEQTEAIGRTLDARHAVAALDRTVALRRPPPECGFHTYPTSVMI